MDGSTLETAGELSLGLARSAWRSARRETGAGEVVLRLNLDGARPGLAWATTGTVVDIAGTVGREAALVYATDLPFASSSVGLVGLVGPEDAIEADLVVECRRVLKSEGRLVVLADAGDAGAPGDAGDDEAARDRSRTTTLANRCTSAGFDVLTSSEAVAVVVGALAGPTAVEQVRRITLTATKDEGRELVGVVMSVAVLRGRGEGRQLYVQHRQAPEDREPVWRGAWELPQGHVEPAEPIAVAAVRELLEETGMRATFSSVVGSEEVSGLTIEHMQPFLATVVRGVANYVALLVLAELEDVGSPESPIAGPGRWVGRRQLARLLQAEDVYPPSRPMLNHLLDQWPPHPGRLG